MIILFVCTYMNFKCLTMSKTEVTNLMGLHAKFSLEVSVTELCLFLLSVVFDEVFGLFSGYRVDMTDFVSEFHAVKLIGGLQQLGSERCGDKLSFFSQVTKHF